MHFIACAPVSPSPHFPADASHTAHFVHAHCTVHPTLPAHFVQCTLLDQMRTLYSSLQLHRTMHTANLSCTKCTLLSAAHTVQLSCTAEEGRPALHSDARWCIQLQCAGSYSELQPCCSCSVVLQAAAAPTISLSLALTVISLCTAQFPPHTGLQLEQGSSLHWVCSFK